MLGAGEGLNVMRSAWSSSFLNQADGIGSQSQPQRAIVSQGRKLPFAALRTAGRDTQETDLRVGAHQ